MAAGGLFGLDAILQAYWPTAKQKLDAIPLEWRRRGEISLIVIAVFYAGFAAWKDEHTALQATIKERNDLRIQLSARSSSEQQKQIDKLMVDNSVLKSEYWDGLSSLELEALYLRLQKMKPQSVMIFCQTGQCRDLLNSLEGAFNAGGWQPTRHTESSMNTLGSGIEIAPKDEISMALKEAIESTTSLRVRVSEFDRSTFGVAEGYWISIGTKPIQ